jgi:hypothetical protein
MLEALWTIPPTFSFKQWVFCLAAHDAFDPFADCGAARLARANVKNTRLVMAPVARN